jgi:hypothetical protein
LSIQPLKITGFVCGTRLAFQPLVLPRALIGWLLLFASLTSAQAAPGKPASRGMGKLRSFARVFRHPALEPAVFDALEKEAESPAHASLRWRPGLPLTAVKNAHRTENPRLLMAGLSGDYNTLEGDVGVQGAVRRIPLFGRSARKAIMRHDWTDGSGLTAAEWRTAAVRSGKMIKWDFKSAGAIAPVLALSRGHDIPDERQVFNFDVIHGPGAASGLASRFVDWLFSHQATLDQLKTVRAQHPGSIIALGARTGPQPAGTRYSAEQLSQLIGYARAIGGPIAFALRAELVEPKVIATLKPYGRVSIWNDPKTYAVADVKAETQRLRVMGVDGVIDLLVTAPN